MKRRKFLSTTSSAVSLPILLGGLPVTAYTKSAVFNNIDDENDRVLVLIQLNGGNDGLNMVIPLDQYGSLSSARPNLLIPEGNVLSLVDETGLHPSMTGVKSLFDEGRLSVIQSVGYPNQNRSHFRSTDIWKTGSAANEFLTTGWMGRYFESGNPDYPEDYPNSDHPDPFAITLGFFVSETCQGTNANFSLALNDPFSLSQLPEGVEDLVPDTPYGMELSFLRQSIAQTNAYSTTVSDAANNANNLATYPENNALANQLKIVANLIAGGLETKVYVCEIGGFDTHANQVVNGETTTGSHASLLEMLSTAISAFQTDLQMLGIDQRVMGMTFSEFGRQIKSNDSLGTDHGSAAPLMVFGSCVNPGIIGDNPEIPDFVAAQEGVAMQYDFRSVYGSILMDWFEVNETAIQNYLFEDFQHLPIVGNCSSVSTEEINEVVEIETLLFPNPCRNYATIQFASKNEQVRISIFDTRGQEIRVLTNQRYSEGVHQIKLETRSFAAGNYYYRVFTSSGQKTKSFVKI